MEKTLILHSEEGRKEKPEEQCVTFQLSPSIQLPADGDYYMGVSQFHYETDGLSFMVEAVIEFLEEGR